MLIRPVGSVNIALQHSRRRAFLAVRSARTLCIALHRSELLPLSVGIRGSRALCILGSLLLLFCSLVGTFALAHLLLQLECCLVRRKFALAERLFVGNT